jgi:hypothetical protein
MGVVPSGTKQVYKITGENSLKTKSALGSFLDFPGIV